MRQCRHCGWTCGADGVCPRCSSDAEEHRDSRDAGVAADASDVWTVIARFANAAEAGYFANELDYHLGCEPRLDFRDDFDALHHRWRTGYALSVPESLADRARAQLQRILEQEPEDAACAGAAIPSIGEAETQLTATSGVSDLSAIKWAPLFLTLAAGSLVIWYSKKVHVQRHPVAPREALRISLRDALGDDSTPWVQESAERGRRELVIDARGEGAILREDRDGDGVFEREMAVSLEN